MEPILRAKVKIFFKSEKKNAFDKKLWGYTVYIRQKKNGVAVIIYYHFIMSQSLVLCM